MINKNRMIHAQQQSSSKANIDLGDKQYYLADIHVCFEYVFFHFIENVFYIFIFSLH